jgi:hypothetical protein
MVDSNLSATLAVASPDQFLQLEREHGLAHDGLAKIDHIATNLIAAALSGRALVNIARTKRGNKNSDVLTLSIPTTERPFIDQTFGLSKQQARGAWFLPEEVSLKASTVNLPAYVRHLPWHAMTIVGEDVARIRLGSTSDALLTWALLIPLFNTLLAPITERAVGSTKSAENQKNDGQRSSIRTTILGSVPPPRLSGSRTAAVGASSIALDRYKLGPNYWIHWLATTWDRSPRDSGHYSCNGSLLPP